MLLLNCRAKKIEGMFDGRITEFEPFEVKFFQDRVEAAHLLLKLMPYGMVDIKDIRLEKEPLFIKTGTNGMAQSVVNPSFTSDFSKGLASLRVTLDGVVGQFRAMNKDRESMKMARELPSPYLIECVKELEWIDEFLKKANSADYDLVEKYMSSLPTMEASIAIDSAETKVVQSDTGSKVGNRSYAKNKGKAGTTLKAA